MGLSLLFLCCIVYLLGLSDAQNVKKRSVRSRPKLLVHVGPHKTGSTSFQSFLVRHSDILIQDNFANPFLKDTKMAANLAWALSHSFSNQSSIEQIEHNWKQCLALALQNGTNLVISSEVFDGYSIEHWRKFANLARSFAIHIIMVYRDAASWFSSQYQEMLWQSNGEEERSFATYVHNAAHEYIDVRDIAARVNKMFGSEHVHIVDYNGMLAAGRSLEDVVFCEMFPTWFRNTCSSVVNTKISIAHANTHRSVLLEKAVHQAVKRNYISSSSYQPLLLKLGAHPNKLPAFPRVCLNEDQLRELWVFTMNVDTKFRAVWGRKLLHNSVTAMVQHLRREFHISSVGTATIFDSSLLSDKWCDLDISAFLASKAMIDWMASLKTLST